MSSKQEQTAENPQSNSSEDSPSHVVNEDQSTNTNHNTQDQYQEEASEKTESSPTSQGSTPYDPSKAETSGGIKLFIGQLPKTMEDFEIKQIFEPYGTIVDFTLIKDRATGTHRGCGFLTYSTRQEAEAAMAALHDKKTFPPAKHPLQIRWAIGETERLESKLFVGMIAKHVDEPTLQSLFAAYGELESVAILRDSATRESKGCAFVKFKNKEDAHNAMNALNYYNLEGSQLSVKIAESDKERYQRKMGRNQMPMFPDYGMNPYGMNPYGAFGYPQAPYYPQWGQYPGYATNTAYGYGAFPMPTGTPTGYGTTTSNPQSSVSGYPDSFVEGPAGCNLFIYHIPQHIGNNELNTLFATYGTVLGSKIFYDKASGQSKGYGFVSYDNPESAQTAIQSLNGYQIGNKRLKVSLKVKGAQRYQPY